MADSKEQTSSDLLTTPHTSTPEPDTMSSTNSIDLSSEDVWAGYIDPALLGTPGYSAASDNASYYEASPYYNNDDDLFANLINARHAALATHPSSPMSEPATYPHHYLDVPTENGARLDARSHSQPPAVSTGAIEFTRNGVGISVKPGVKHPYPVALRDRGRGRDQGERSHPYKRSETSKASNKRRGRSVRSETPSMADYDRGLPMNQEPAVRGMSRDRLVDEEHRSLQEFLWRLNDFMVEAGRLRDAVYARLEDCDRRA